MARDRWLDDAVAAARAAHPEWAVPDDGFRAFLTDKLAGGAEEPAHVAALHLVYACAEGDRAALAELERDYLAPLPGVLVRGGAAHAHADEAVQGLRTRLLTAGVHGRARIASYAGRGDLRGWLRVGATRELVRLLQRHRRETPLDTGALAAAAVGDDPATRYLRSEHGDDFKRAFTAALAELTPRQRRLLRYQVVERLGIDDIGRLCRVHRATAARWLAEARETLGALTRTHLAAQLQIDSGEIESVIRAVDSQIDVSVERLLGARAPARR